MMLWFITIIALIGIVLNIQKKRECFLLWMFSNFNWAIYNFRIGEYTQAILFAVFFWFSFIGFGRWTYEKKSQLPAATKTFCNRIIKARNFPADTTRIKIDWLFDGAKKLLRIIENEKE